ncbi:hypothetical protein MLC59_02165 [Marinobacter bryozoorum]|uniref:hypothetical protein n=1 Tax=Marinobacter bryozoorum TaxID=256324 RepID=UPI0020060AC2|nr:hypothetical protein [Marinobacter bryozoorum]MCK7542975.1 hypothetical protein [Marinobacter bryozoorum]
MIISGSLASSWAQTLLTEIASGTADLPKLQIYSDPAPASTTETVTGTLLAEAALIQTAGTESGGVVTLEFDSGSNTALASGDATWGRIINRDGDTVGIFTVGPEDSSAELKLTSSLFAQGLPVTITSATIQIGS